MLISRFLDYPEKATLTLSSNNDSHVISTTNANIITFDLNKYFTIFNEKYKKFCYHILLFRHYI